MSVLSNTLRQAFDRLKSVGCASLCPAKVSLTKYNPLQSHFKTDG